MKVKPYRRCDICNDDYLKVKNCMKIKYYRTGDYRMIDNYTETGGEYKLKWETGEDVYK